jgi:hypothetical protein
MRMQSLLQWILPAPAQPNPTAHAHCNTRPLRQVYSLSEQNRFYKKAAGYCLRAVAKHSPELAQAVVDSGALDSLVTCLEEFDPGVKVGLQGGTIDAHAYMDLSCMHAALMHAHKARPMHATRPRHASKRPHPPVHRAGGGLLVPGVHGRP